MGAEFGRRSEVMIDSGLSPGEMKVNAGLSEKKQEFVRMI